MDYYNPIEAPIPDGVPPPNITQQVAPNVSAPTPRVTRRNRMITSCLECRRRKLKCNKSHPCINCTKFSRDCIFLAPALDRASQLKLKEIKEKMGSLESQLGRDVAQSYGGPSSFKSPSSTADRPVDPEDDLSANEDEGGLEPTSLATADAGYELDGDDDDLLDLGIQLGKMRITERIGGFFRPKLAQELQISIKAITGNNGNGSMPLSSPHAVEALPPAQEWLKPGPTYIAPASGFFFGQNSNHKGAFANFLPSKSAADRIIRQYFTAVHPIAKAVHRPAFEREYAIFWDEVSLGIEPPNSVQAMIFAAMFSGVVSMDEPIIFQDFGVSKSTLTGNLKLGTETALGRANFLRTTKIETLQAFVMYLIPLCRAEVSRAHSVLVGAAVRMAECMGLHRDGETYGMNPLETHIRRLIWHQLCFLDIRTCEAQGPQPLWRDTSDTKLPLNMNDTDLIASEELPVSVDRWTDTTFSLIRFEINQMMQVIWVDRLRLDRRKITLTTVLHKIETFRARMSSTYDHLMDDHVPVQKCAKMIKTLLTSRLYITVLHRYHNSTVSPMPDRLRKIMIAAGIATLEAAIALETFPEVQTWAWYGGALQQYHTAFLLLMEVNARPDIKEADRIWACLDYIYECDSRENRQTRAQKILLELQEKTAVYQSMRGIRAPVVMEKHIEQKQRPHHASDMNKSPTGPPRSDDISAKKAEIPEIPPTNRTLTQDVVFSGISNGKSLWAAPGPQTPETAGDNDIAIGNAYMSGNDTGGDDMMADFDWDAFDALFPPENPIHGLDPPAVYFPAPITGAGRS